MDKKKDIDQTRKLINPDDDKIAKSAVKALEEEITAADDDVEMDVGGKPGKIFGKK